MFQTILSNFCFINFFVSGLYLVVFQKGTRMSNGKEQEEEQEEEEEQQLKSLFDPVAPPQVKTVC